MGDLEMQIQGGCGNVWNCGEGRGLESCGLENIELWNCLCWKGPKTHLVPSPFHGQGHLPLVQVVQHPRGDWDEGTPRKVTLLQERAWNGDVKTKSIRIYCSILIRNQAQSSTQRGRWDAFAALFVFSVPANVVGDNESSDNWLLSVWWWSV